MNKLPLFRIVLLLLAGSSDVLAQDTLAPKKTDDPNIQQQLENMAENGQSEDADYSSLLDVYTYYKEHRINLNHADPEDLKQLNILSDIQINALETHIRKTGNLITIYELQGIEGFDLETIQKLLPYVYVSDQFSSAHFSVKEMFRSGENSVIFRYGRVLEKQTGFSAIDSAGLYNSPNSRYIGSPDKLYLRYRFTYSNNISWGITAEKDQGELFWKNKQIVDYPWYTASLKGNQHTGFDFYSAHLYLHNIRFVKSLAIGDYQASFGQGLACWTGYAFGKGIDIVSTKRSAAGIKPYTSVDENRFLRGAASTLQFGKFEISGFFSSKHVDANISDTLADGETLAVSSLQETGYHSTPAEISDKDAINQTVFGGNVHYTFRNFSIGATAVHYQLDKEFTRTLSYYNQFDFNSKENTNASIDYNLILRNFNFYGEEALSANGGMAFVNGVLVSLDPRLSLTVMHRYYERNYQNLLSNAFAENTTAANEKGLFIGINAKLFRGISFSGYMDRFEFPWMKYQVNAPSHGSDYVAQLNYTPNKVFDAYFKIRSRSKYKNTAQDITDIDFIVPYNQTNYRINTSFAILPSVKLKNRIELLDYKLDNGATQKGFLAYQDITYSRLGKPFSFSLRYALFQTDNYDTRIYAYENDVPGAYSIPAYYYKGARFYVLLDYNLTRKIEIWFRYSQTAYANQDMISAGSLTEIQGNTKSEIRAQIRIKF